MEVYSDSTAAISAQSRLGMCKMKHVQLRNIFVQDKVRSGDMRLLQVHTDENVSDIGTKPVDQRTREKHVVSIGMQPAQEQRVYNVEGQSRHHKVRGSSDLAKLAAMVSQCGGCLTSLAGMIPGAKAENDITVYENTKVAHFHCQTGRSTEANILWLIVLVLAVHCCARTFRAVRTATVATQTSHEIEMAQRTIESLRAQARNRP